MYLVVVSTDLRNDPGHSNKDADIDLHEGSDRIQREGRGCTCRDPDPTSSCPSAHPTLPRALSQQVVFLQKPDPPGSLSVYLPWPYAAAALSGSTPAPHPGAQRGKAWVQTSFQLCSLGGPPHSTFVYLLPHLMGNGSNTHGVNRSFERIRNHIHKNPCVLPGCHSAAHPGLGLSRPRRPQHRGLVCPVVPSGWLGICRGVGGVSGAGCRG